MTLESNKRDFEKALEEMKVAIEALDHCVDDVIMDTLKSVVDEYEIHYSSNIQEMMNSNEEMKDKIEDLSVS